MPIDRTMRNAARLALAIAIAAGGWSSARAAAPLAPEACEALQAEHAGMLAAGIGDTMRKGPGWVRANLGPEKVREVQRFIAVQEQLLFKCGGAKLRELPLPDDEAADTAPAKGTAKGPDAAAVPVPPAPRKAAAPPEKAKAVPPPRTRRKDEVGETSKARKPKDKAKEKASDTSKGKAAPRTAAEAQKPRPKPKPKVDDAYRPPAKAAPARD